jgi:hypothetical protein
MNDLFERILQTIGNIVAATKITRFVGKHYGFQGNNLFLYSDPINTAVEPY